MLELSCPWFDDAWFICHISRNLSVDGGPAVCDEMIEKDVLTPVLALIHQVNNGWYFIGMIPDTMDIIIYWLWMRNVVQSICNLHGCCWLKYKLKHANHTHAMQCITILYLGDELFELFLKGNLFFVSKFNGSEQLGEKQTDRHKKMIREVYQHAFYLLLYLWSVKCWFHCLWSGVFLLNQKSLNLIAYNDCAFKIL